MSRQLPVVAPASVPINCAADIVQARRCVRQLGAALGFGYADQTRLATAVAELARNVVDHAGAGVCRIDDVSDAAWRCVRIVVEDHGPGIASIERATQDGVSGGGGLGAGLPGVRRLTDSFMIESRPGLTRVTISLSARKELP
ncbi:ATP-binding protein [Massilia sp. DWR3-1-1]|uniref:ATP-binding protein n=1 Tax=Massilia sp. DWR3-1-1 TaxID=2804559 RepID=UPI003CF6869F